MSKKHPGVYLRGKVYWIKYSRNGRPFRESSHSEKESDAVRLLNLRRGDIARGVHVTPRIGRVKIDELLEDVASDYQMNGKRSAKDLKFRLKHLLPFFGGRKAADITTADIRRYIVSRQTDDDDGTGALNGTVNRELSLLRRAFTLAVQSRKLITKPHIPMLAENNVRTGFFEPEQFNAVIKHLPQHVKPVARFAYITGWRANSEILPLQWRQVDFQAGTVRLDPGTTKNREGRVFPMTQELRALLMDQRAKTETLQRQQGALNPWVFMYAGRPFKSFRKAWNTARKAAGLPDRLAHDFRRTAVRNLVRAGIPERVAMQMTGHKTRSVFERYNIVSQGDLFDAARRLDAFRGTISGTVAHETVQLTKGASPK